LVETRGLNGTTVQIHPNLKSFRVQVKLGFNYSIPPIGFGSRFTFGWTFSYRIQIRVLHRSDPNPTHLQP